MISVIVVNYNGGKYIKGCLTAVLASNYSDFELVVVDDGSTDNSCKIVQEYKQKKQVKLIKLEQNNGASVARNSGVKKTKGEILFFLDIDTQVKRNCLQMTSKAFARDKKLGAGQAKLVLQETGKIETVGHFLSPFGFPYEINHPKKLKDNQIFGGRSAALAVRRNVFTQIGGFDEDYLIYGEDTDLCWRTWMKGYEVKYLPEAEVTHFSKSSMSKNTRVRMFYEGTKNNTSNILKNANLTTILWILPLHILSWFVVSIKLILQGRTRMAGYIYRGLGWNIKNLRKTLAKRKSPKKIKITFGPLGQKEILLKGKRWLKAV